MTDNAQQSQPPRKQEKKVVLDLSKYFGQRVKVKFAGGREVDGLLKGYDTLMNLVIDDCVEYLRDPEDPYTLTGETRKLGLTVCRGPTVVWVCPLDGFEEISNPFLTE
eukprot:Clim_evm100s25 gene=Clim_evmTU100s25